MNRARPISSSFPLVRALALVALTLFLGLGGALHPQATSANTPAQASMPAMADPAHAAHSANSVDPASGHCAAAATCLAPAEAAGLRLTAPKAQGSRAAIAGDVAPATPSYGLFRPPRRA